VVAVVVITHLVQDTGPGVVTAAVLDQHRSPITKAPIAIMASQAERLINSRRIDVGAALTVILQVVVEGVAVVRTVDNPMAVTAAVPE
jgi:hypothetical protein